MFKNLKQSVNLNHFQQGHIKHSQSQSNITPNNNIYYLPYQKQNNSTIINSRIPTKSNSVSKLSIPIQTNYIPNQRIIHKSQQIQPYKIIDNNLINTPQKIPIQKIQNIQLQNNQQQVSEAKLQSFNQNLQKFINNQNSVNQLINKYKSIIESKDQQIQKIQELIKKDSPIKQIIQQKEEEIFDFNDKFDDISTKIPNDQEKNIIKEYQQQIKDYEKIQISKSKNIKFNKSQNKKINKENRKNEINKSLSISKNCDKNKSLKKKSKINIDINHLQKNNTFVVVQTIKQQNQKYLELINNNLKLINNLQQTKPKNKLIKYIQSKQNNQNQSIYIAKKDQVFSISSGIGKNGNQITSIIQKNIQNILNEEKEQEFNILQVLHNTCQKIENNQSGAQVLLVQKLVDQLYIANIGNGGVLICSKDNENWKLNQLTNQNQIHKTFNQNKCIGNFNNKNNQIDWIPEINQYQLNNDDKIVLIANQGLFQLLSNRECIDIIMKYYDSKNIDQACETLMEIAQYNQNKFNKNINIDFILIFLN